MKALAHNLSALTLLLASGQGSADVIYSNLQNLDIPTTYDGTYIDVDGGHAASTGTFTGWDVNFYMGGVYMANNSQFQPGRTAANDMGTLQKFAVGDSIDTGMLVGSGMGGSINHLGTSGTQFHAGDEGYLGFKTGTGNYGWMRVVFTNNTSGAVIKDWAYDNSGATGAINVGRIKQDAAIGNTQLVTLSPDAGESFTLGSLITNNGAIVNRMDKTGAGTTILTGSHTYTGTTTVSEGTLRIDGSTDASSSISVGVSGTLGGTGTIGGSVNVTGVLAPGASVESLATGALTMNTGSTFAYEVGADHNADLLAATGLSLTDVTLGFDSTTLTNLGSNSWSPGASLTLISYTGAVVSSGFVGYADDGVYIFGSNTWLFDYNNTLAGSNFESEATATGPGTNFVTMTLVPEPSAAVLGGLGILFLLSRRRDCQA